jgi:hypothetical protein
MSNSTRSLVCICSLFLAVSTISAKTWRGIEPLHSTRDDVKRLLGEPEKSSTYAFLYRSQDEIAVIHFQTTSCKDECGFGWNVPLETVISIGVIPKTKSGKAELSLTDKFKVENTDGGFVYYTNEEEGVSVEKYNGTITLKTFLPANIETPSRCPRIQECIVDFFPKFDEYTNLSFEDEKARLDNYVIQMKEIMGRGAIVVYGENPAVRARLMKRAERSKRYLIDKEVESQRLLIVNGGHKDRSIIELHLYPIGEGSRIYLFPEKDPANSGAQNKRLERTRR